MKKNYKVEIEFKKGPALSHISYAVSEPAAKGDALVFARNSGYMEQVKKLKATEVV